MDDKISQFCTVTGASSKEARRYLEKHNRRLDLAIDAYYNEPTQNRLAATAPSTTKLNSLFDKYKGAVLPRFTTTIADQFVERHEENITTEGTIQLCQDLAVDPEDVVLLAVAYELKSPGMAEWTRQGWVDGWKNLGCVPTIDSCWMSLTHDHSCDTIPAMRTALIRLRDKLGSDPTYFQQVYNFTFEFSRAPGQRSLGLDMAQAFWALLLPLGLQGGALAHIVPRSADSEGEYDDEDDAMTGVEEEGWQEESTTLWFEFLQEKGGKGISKDTWQMFLEFVRTIDAQFEKYDMEAAWPSLIDDFVQYAKARLAAQNR